MLSRQKMNTQEPGTLTEDRSVHYATYAVPDENLTRPSSSTLLLQLLLERRHNFLLRRQAYKLQIRVNRANAMVFAPFVFVLLLATTDREIKEDAGGMKTEYWDRAK
jgi:hypothetical protein